MASTKLPTSLRPWIVAFILVSFVFVASFVIRMLVPLFGHQLGWVGATDTSRRHRIRDRDRPPRSGAGHLKRGRLRLLSGRPLSQPDSQMNYRLPSFRGTFTRRAGNGS